MNPGVDAYIRKSKKWLEEISRLRPILVEQLQDRLDADSAFKAAFEALTPGRQREYNLYFSGARQAATRAARVEKYARKILGAGAFATGDDD